jgi:hypothetical protein
MSRLIPTQIVKESWRITLANVWVLMGLLLGSFVFQMVLGGLLGPADQKNPTGVEILAQIAMNLIFVALSICIMVAVLKIVRGSPTPFQDFFKPLSQYLNFLGFSIVYGLIVIVGFILLIVPGVIWQIKYSLGFYLIADRKLSIGKALTESARLTDGAKSDIFVIGILVGLINLAGLLAIFLGLLVTIPMAWVASAVVYLALSEGSAPTPTGASGILAMPTPPVTLQQNSSTPAPSTAPILSPTPTLSDPSQSAPPSPLQN